MMATRSFEWLDRRALAAIRFVDAVTGAPADGRIALAASGVSVARNRSGAVVVLAAPGLEEHRTSFTAPPPTRRWSSARRTLTRSAAAWPDGEYAGDGSSSTIAAANSESGWSRWSGSGSRGRRSANRRAA